MADTKRTTGRSLEEKLQVLHNLHGTIYRPDQTGRQIVPCKPALRTFARHFSNIDFFLQILPLKGDELVMSEM